MALFTSVQTLSGVTQFVLVEREYAFEQNVRTWYVDGQDRHVDVGAQQRAKSVEPQNRTYTV